ncbi:hypothetical protein [Streptomyces mirabilis]|uniref:hypothetical protein n=1 Tax=Streptomyces mirabilis TaxID=68239 RepID=UPI00332D6CF0
MVSSRAPASHSSRRSVSAPKTPTQAEKATASWALGLGSGLLFSTSDWFTGPPASNNPVGEYGLGWVATVAVSFLLYAVLPRPAVAPVARPAKGSATMAV